MADAAKADILVTFPPDPVEIVRLAGERGLEVAMFGAGCFWGVELSFEQTEGVVDTEVGYAGGHLQNPDYRTVCTDTTGHAEVVLVLFDPARLEYAALVRRFFELHDPTQVNRQGPDIGRQYRSAVFAFGEDQLEAAARVKAELEAAGRYPRPIATEIEPAAPFYRAETYHQDYLRKKGVTSCSVH